MSAPRADVDASATGAGGTWRLEPRDVEAADAFRAGLPALARRCGRPEDSVLREARGYLAELRTAHVSSVYRRVVAVGRRLLASGYERVEYDDAQVERVRVLAARQPIVVLASHRSYLDGAALTVGFAAHRLPALTVFAGANMAFWPIGAIWRRANAVFIRRVGPTPVYGYALRHVVGALLERRRPLQWFVEGTRSRSGLLGAPRLGLLVYVADAYRDGRVDDVALLPASIAYDQLREVEEYAAASLGRPKPPETLGWLVRFVRAQRGRHGAIHVRFGEPVSLRAALGPRDALPAAGTPAARAALESLAAEVSRRIARTTPLTGAALVGVALLAAGGRALTEAELRAALQPYLDHARRRGVPMVAGAELDRGDALPATLAALHEHGVVATHAGGPVIVHGLAPGRELWAAYYRNTIVQHYVAPAVAELALLAAAREAALGASIGQAAFDIAVRELHALLAADLHLADADAFAAEVRAELAATSTDWRERLAAGSAGVDALLERAPVLCSDLMLRPLFEAHAVAAEWLAGHAGETDDSVALAGCLALGRQWVLQRRLRHGESVSQPLLAAGLRAARAGRTDRGRATAWLRAMDVVHRIAVRRLAARVAGV